MSINGPIEPSAQLREAANAMRQMFVALIDEGFSEAEALQIIGHILRGQSSPP